MSENFPDRRSAGRALAAHLLHYRNTDKVHVLALPRGGVPVGYEVALTLHAPLDVFLVRKLGFPDNEELAMGAVASGGLIVLNELGRNSGIPKEILDAIIAKETAELLRREVEYRQDRPKLRLDGSTVIIVDDGLATGSTMRASAEALRLHQPARIVVAVPVAAEETCERFSKEVDEVVCLMTPSPFHAVGMWYNDFAQIDDDEVKALLEQANLHLKSWHEGVTT